MKREIMELTDKLARCQAACNYCMDACLKEEDVQMMARCLKLDWECAQLCALTASMVAARAHITKDILEVCITACEECAEECRKHKFDHCRECALECEHCAEACQQFVERMDDLDGEI